MAEVCPIAVVYEGTTAAVLMATAAHLADLATGFRLTEGIVHDISEIEELDLVPGSDGIELRMWLRPDNGRLLKERQRRLVGATVRPMRHLKACRSPTDKPCDHARDVSDALTNQLGRQNPGVSMPKP